MEMHPIYDWLLPYRYPEFYNNLIIRFWITIGMSSTPGSLNLHFTSVLSALLLVICCFSSWTNLTRDYSPHTRPTWWRWPPPSCWPAWPRWASSSWCSPTSSRGSAPCIINVKRTRQQPDQIGYKGTLTWCVNVKKKKKIWTKNIRTNSQRRGTERKYEETF